MLIRQKATFYRSKGLWPKTLEKEGRGSENDYTLKEAGYLGEVRVSEIGAPLENSEGLK